MSARDLAVQAREEFLSWLFDRRRASYGLALMRMAFGGMTLVTLALATPYYSYSYGAASRWGEAVIERSSINQYPWPLPFPFDRADSDPVLYVKVSILAVVAVLFTLGWRMRIVGPLFTFLWLGWTALNPVITNSGHYQTFRIMLIFMLFADLSRRWSLDAWRRSRADITYRGRDPLTGIVPPWFPTLLNNVAVILIGFQLCTIYITSALWKLQGSTWNSGVAVYYPLRLEELTLIPWLNDLVWQVTPLVYVATWMAVYFQLLFPVMLLNRWTRMIGLIGITGMHLGIGLLLALPWFSLVMISADMIFIRERSWAWLRSAAGRLRDRLRGRKRVDDTAPAVVTDVG